MLNVLWNLDSSCTVRSGDFLKNMKKGERETDAEFIHQIRECMTKDGLEYVVPVASTVLESLSKENGNLV